MRPEFEKFIQPLVSVVIPTYNHAHFLSNALQSVIDQTYTKWEVIVIDNYSSDNTDDVVKSFNNPKIKILKNSIRIIGSSRNIGIQAAKGEWIAFLDSDDIWYPQKLEKSIETLSEDEDFDVISTDELMVNKISDKTQVLHHGPYQENFYKKLLIDGNRLSTSATLVKRDFIDKKSIFFSEKLEFFTAEDYDFWLNLAFANATFKFVPSIQGEYLIHLSNNSGKYEKHFSTVRNVLKNHVFYIQNFTEKKQKLWDLVNSRFIVNSSVFLLKQGKFLLGIKFLYSAFSESPFGVLAYIKSRLQTKSIY